MSKDLKDQLIRLGAARPDLRKDIRPILASLDKNASAIPRNAEHIVAKVVQALEGGGMDLSDLPDRRTASAIYSQIFNLIFDYYRRPNQQIVQQAARFWPSSLPSEDDVAWYNSVNDARMVTVMRKALKKVAPHLLASLKAFNLKGL